MTKYPSPRPATLAQRAIELEALQLPGATISFASGRELRFRFRLTPGPFSRVYTCLLKVRPDGKMPDLIVLEPDLYSLAGGRAPPHIYRHDGPGAKLCLWWPKQREWMPQMQLSETYIPWASEWLWYFEDWLATDEWAGGGEHPAPKRKRWK